MKTLNFRPFFCLLAAFLFFVIFCIILFPKRQQNAYFDLKPYRNYVASLKERIAKQDSIISALHTKDTIVLHKYKIIRDTIKVKELPELKVVIDSIYGTVVLIDDSLLGFNKFQARAIAVTHVDLLECKDRLDLCRQVSSAKDTVILLQDSIIKADSLAITAIDKELKMAKKEVVKERFFKRVWQGVSGVLAVVILAH